MIEGKITDGTNTIDIKGRVIVGTIIDPAESKADYMSLVLGQGSVMDIMPQVASCVGAALSKMVKDPVERSVVLMFMMERLKSAAYGGDIRSEVVREEITPAKEDANDDK